jgi:predicted nuclease of predicted toxin-antitoxin system
VKILLDMNLTPDWVDYFAAWAIEAVHWSIVGDPRADDSVIMDYARQAGMVVFTHDLDFGNVLAVTHALGPSVIQARVEDPVPAVIGKAVVSAIRDHATDLQRGALITLDPDRLRARILPILPGMRT